LFLDNLEKAKYCFIKCLEDDIEDQSALYNVVYCFEFLDQYQDAINYLNSYIDRNPYSEIAWHQQGRLYYIIKDYENALRCFDYATIVDDTFIGAYIEKGKSLERLKRFEEAIACFKQTMEFEAPTSYALLRIGKCYEKLGDKSKALKYYNQTVHEDPLLDKGWIAITDFYIRQKSFQKALYFANKALSIDNENQRYWKRYATINRELNFFEEAELGYRKAVGLGDSDFDTWLFWSDILQFLGEFETAISTLIQASEFFAEESEIEYRLAGLYFMIKDVEKGKFHLNKALQINASHRILLEELFPVIWDQKDVQNVISKFLKSK
ncbi:MAG TPA: tetratricopeptide repeat protein, partial [Flavobacterium sp.]|nr:tetratricopeptide repeat protein [Flavobacterium sp.]